MKKLFFAFLLLLPFVSLAEVRINEIAWMGDLVSADHEWIELANDSTSPVDLMGWKMVATDSSDSTKEKFSFLLTGSISPNGYYLIERKHSASDTASYLASDFTTSSFSLVNSGETLALLKSDGMKSSEVISPFKTKWEKGDNTTKETMQWDGAKWITAVATPRADNKTTDSTPSDTTPTPTSDTKVTSPSTSLDNSAHVSPLPLSDFSQKQELYISAGRNRIVAVGTPVVFESYAIDAKDTKVSGISSIWSFGDGAQAGGVKVSHTYKYAGDYVVVLNANAGGNEAVARAEIRVFAPKILLSLERDGSVSLTNESLYECNLGGAYIVNGTNTFIVPQDTIIKKGTKISFSKTVTSIDFTSSEWVNLLMPDNTIAATYTKPATSMLQVATSTESVIEKKEVIDAPIIVVHKKKQTVLASAVLATPTKNVEDTPTERIVLKKPDGFFAKLWNSWFKK